MKQTTVPIAGMHCRSCELLIEGELSQIPGVSKVSVSEKKACAVIDYEHQLNVGDVEAAVVKAGYRVGIAEKKPLLTKNIADYVDIFYALVALFFLYIVVDSFGLTKLFGVGGGHPSSLVTVLLIGLTAGFSTCMALIGGLVLGISTRFAQSHPDATSMEKFTPHLWFNAGRIVSYALFGGIIGAIGSLFQFSSMSLGFMTLAVALVMLTLGAQLTGLFPRLATFSFALPKSLGRLFGIKDTSQKTYSTSQAFLTGAGTFFLPCGFTQAMQLYAVSSGNPISGALIMGVFAIGTAPGLLGIGGITAMIRGLFAQKFFKFAGVVVVAFSLFNINNGLNLIGWNPLAFGGANSNVLAATSGTTIKNNVAEIRMTQSASGYKPNNFTIVKNVPVKWIINSVDVNTCASSIVSSKIGVRINLHPGENVVEFTPKEVGTIPFSCSMGMYRGSFTVVDDNNAAVKGVADDNRIAVASPSPVVNGASAGGSCGGGGGCGCGGAKKQVVEQKGDVATITDGEQVLRTIYTTASDISPNTFTVSLGKPVRLEIDAKDDGSGCMSSIMVSGQTEPQLLQKGKTIVLSFTPTKTGDYAITCAMGVPRGKIKVI